MNSTTNKEPTMTTKHYSVKWFTPAGAHEQACPTIKAANKIKSAVKASAPDATYIRTETIWPMYR
jgi:hypothetical protein